MQWKFAMKVHITLELVFYSYFDGFKQKMLLIVFFLLYFVANFQWTIEKSKYLELKIISNIFFLFSARARASALLDLPPRHVGPVSRHIMFYKTIDKPIDNFIMGYGTKKAPKYTQRLRGKSRFPGGANHHS